MLFKQEKNVLRVFLKGDFDLTTAPIVRDKIDDFIDNHAITMVIFDFSDVSFMDSSGLGIVLGRYKKLAPFGGSVRVEKVNSRVMNVFTMSGLDQIMKITAIKKSS